MNSALKLTEWGFVPDFMIRYGIRRLLQQRLRQEYAKNNATPRLSFQIFLQQLRNSPIALLPEKANEQHYELHPAFFQKVLGSRLKYSGCYWPTGVRNLDEAEESMLRLTCDRAQLEDGMDILELGCGWGAITLWMAERYPASRIVAVSNSGLQKEFIEAESARRNFSNVEIVTADMNDFSTSKQFDRIVSVEMFEHMRNYEQLLARVATWLKPEGKLFVHIFCHKELTYPFETEGADNWMGQYFFTGGLMPADDLFLYFQKDLLIEQQWRVGGQHYAKTAEAWLKNLDEYRGELLPLFGSTYRPENVSLWLDRWRLFFLACAELFGYRRGQEWWVAHYLFRKRVKE